MRYWFVHIILVGVLVAIWVPPLVQSDYLEVEAMEATPEYADRYTEYIPSADSTYMEDSEPQPDHRMEPPASAMASVQEPSMFTVIVEHIKELGSLAIMFGNILTFMWQWKDRKAKSRVA